MGDIMKRRNISKLLVAATTSAWITPIITAVTLPVHAQTSECKTNDVVGSWAFSILDFHLTIQLNSDGTGMLLGQPSEDVTWALSGRNLLVSVVGEVFPISLDGTFDSLCETLTGIADGRDEFTAIKLPQ